MKNDGSYLRVVKIRSGRPTRESYSGKQGKEISNQQKRRKKKYVDGKKGSVETTSRGSLCELCMEDSVRGSGEKGRGKGERGKVFRAVCRS